MEYAGFVVDQLYGSPDQGQDAVTLNPHRSPAIFFTKRRGPLPRIYSDEVPMCAGMQAFNQMCRVFKSKHPGKWLAWRAWRKLV